jgi:hypothetical protein
MPLVVKPPLGWAVVSLIGGSSFLADPQKHFLEVMVVALFV